MYISIHRILICRDYVQLHIQLRVYMCKGIIIIMSIRFLCVSVHIYFAISSHIHRHMYNIYTVSLRNHDSRILFIRALI